MESIIGKTIKEINVILSVWVTSIRLNTSINYTDANIDAENVACGLLNLVYGWNLVNLNNYQMNYPGVDLGDIDAKVCVQVTSERNSRKIRATIEKVDRNNLSELFQTLYIFCLTVDNDISKADIKSKTMSFSVKDNVITISTIVKRIATLNETIIKNIKKYLLNCFGENSKYFQYCYDTPYEFLFTQMKDVHTLCYSKMQSLGLDFELAESIWEKELLDFNIPEFTEPITYLIGEFGSGKSHFLYTFYIYLWKKYVENSRKEIIPIFIQGRMLNKGEGIHEWLQKNLSYNSSMNVFLFIDGIDEMSYKEAEFLIEDIKIIGYQNKGFKALIASRPVSVIESENIYKMPPLSLKQAEELYSQINNGSKMEKSVFYGNNREAFEKMLTKPLFTILYSLYFKERNCFLSSAMDLVNIFVEKSLDKVLKRNPEIKTQLEELAVLSINSNLGYINKSELYGMYDDTSLLATGFIYKKQDSYCFVLPIVAQWLGAMAIRDNLISIENIIEDTEILFSWRYSLSILFSQISFEESEKHFSKILQKTPGMASLIVSDGICFEGSGSLPTKSISANRLYLAFEQWTSLFREIHLGLTDKHGNLTTLWYQQSHDCVKFSFADVNLGKKIIYNLESNDKYHFPGYNLHRVYAQATWPWIISFEKISNCLSKMVKAQTYFLKDSIMEQEYLWKCTLAIKGAGELFSGEVHVNELKTLRKIADTTDNCYHHGINLSDYFKLLDRCNKKQDVIKPPFPVGDIDHYEHGWIWGNYSETRMLERIQFIYEKALELYPTFINTFFPRLREQLSTYVLLPVKIEGVLLFDKNDKSYNGKPSLTRIAYPIQSGGGSIVRFSLRNVQTNSDMDRILLKKAYNECKLHRSDCYPYIKITLKKGRCFDTSPTPVTDLIYRWLNDDLKNIGWIK